MYRISCNVRKTIRNAVRSVRKREETMRLRLRRERSGEGMPFLVENEILHDT